MSVRCSRRDALRAAGRWANAAMVGFGWAVATARAPAQALLWTAGPAAGESPPPTSHDPFGRVEPPQEVPPLRLTADDGRPIGLARHLRGRSTAVQLMFTGCSAICPIQGALFAEVAVRLDPSDSQLLSLSIDPLADDARALRRWLDQHGAGPAWRAAAPRTDDLDRILDFLRGRASGVDRHTGQVYLFDREARLVWRTPDLPPAEHVVQMLKTVAALR